MIVGPMNDKKLRQQGAPKKLLESASHRTKDFVSRLTRAMGQMEQDIENGGGLYPFNKGRISQSEVCRRAGVSKVTLQGKRHKTTTKKVVDDWVAKVLAGVVSGKKNIRRVVTGRADEWKEAHRLVAQARHVDQLKFDLVSKRNRELEDENAALRGQLNAASSGRVVALPKKK